mmetsp:Transcript_65880/g.182113  ORF Transcript_65880/g.182113 Transcript_65880/m.182113 type:complete len:97 (+) Transcript_65880:895-1185(+)
MNNPVAEVRNKCEMESQRTNNLYTDDGGRDKAPRFCTYKCGAVPDLAQSNNLHQSMLREEDETPKSNDRSEANGLKGPSIEAMSQKRTAHDELYQF